MPIVGRLIAGQGVTDRATQSLRMQHLEQKAVTPILIEQVVDRYQHGVGGKVRTEAPTVKTDFTSNRS